MKRKNMIIGLLVIVTLLAGWFFFVRDSAPRGISNPPTAEELKRIEEIEESRSQRDPDAKTGVGVRPVGTLPPPTAPKIEIATTSTSTATSTLE